MRRLPVEKQDAGVEVGGEEDPHEVGDLEVPGELVALTKRGDRRVHERAEEDDPHEGESIGAEVKEDDRPEEIDRELGEKYL